MDETNTQEQVIESQEPEAIEETTESLQEQPQSSKPSPQESFRQLREQKERAERERDDLMRRFTEIESRQKELSQAAQKPLDPDYGDDDLIEGRHLKKEREAIKKELDSYRSRMEELSTESRIKNNYPDFEGIVTNHSIEQLRKLYPSIAASINSNPNLYEKAEAAYAAIKQFGLYERTEFNKDKELAQKNQQKPRTVSSLNPQQGETPLSRANAFANGLTPELERQLRKEVEDAIRSR